VEIYGLTWLKVATRPNHKDFRLRPPLPERDDV
jgi:hypothetical protein